MSDYTGYTPGPWYVQYHTVYSPDGGIVAWCGDGRSEYDSDKAQDELFSANARLIAAAPELLAEVDRLREALADCIGVLESCQNADANEHGMVTAQISEARAALAEGGQDG